MVRALIFDMDGVLINSTPYSWEAFRLVLQEENIPFSTKVADVKGYLGMSLPDLVKVWKRDFNITIPYDLNTLSQKIGKIELELFKQNIRPNSHLHDLLQQAKDAKIKRAVATSSFHWRTQNILRLLKIHNQFDAIVNAEDVVKHKPHPDVFLKAASKVQEQPKDCIVFEDAVFGIQAARRAKMKCIAIKTPYYTRKELSAADKIIQNFSQINLSKINSILFKN
ncbi:HAD family phosphatase [Candidatus Woesearchaeota archaeon]|nr:HAD family phosphatase [Candidatus Woesearchaeota archaeon]